MYMDDFLEFCDATSVGTPNNSTVSIGDEIDLQEARDIVGGEPFYCVVQVTTAITSGGSATVKFKVVSDSTADASVDGTASEHGSTDDIPVASLVAGATYIIPLMPEGVAYERYLNFQVTETAGQALTAGNVNAFLTRDVPKYTAYADAVN